LQPRFSEQCNRHNGTFSGARRRFNDGIPLSPQNSAQLRQDFIDG